MARRRRKTRGREIDEEETGGRGGVRNGVETGRVGMRGVGWKLMQGTKKTGALIIPCKRNLYVDKKRKGKVSARNEQTNK